MVNLLDRHTHAEQYALSVEVCINLCSPGFLLETQNRKTCFNAQAKYISHFFFIGLIIKSVNFQVVILLSWCVILQKCLVFKCFESVHLIRLR